MQLGDEFFGIERGSGTYAGIEQAIDDQQAGLLPAIVQDAGTLRVLMLGYMSRESLALTLASGRVAFFSRSRQRLWMKGETSGDVLETESGSSTESTRTLVPGPL